MMSDDQNFKNLICDFPLEAIQFAAPEEADMLPPGVKIDPWKQETLKERLGDSFRELDVPLEVEFPNGEKEAIIFVFENEARSRADFLHYLAIVCLNISRAKKTRRVVPVAIHLKRRTPLKTRLTLESDCKTYLEFNCISCVLHTMKASDHSGSSNIFARLLLPLMAHDPKDNLLVARQSAEGLVALSSIQELRVKYYDFIAHYAQITEAQEKEFFEKYISESPYREEIMTLHQVYVNREAKSKAEGKEEGKEEGKILNVMEMFRDGDISAAMARARLERLAKEGAIPQELVKQALAEIDAASA